MQRMAEVSVPSFHLSAGSCFSAAFQQQFQERVKAYRELVRESPSRSVSFTLLDEEDYGCGCGSLSGSDELLLLEEVEQLESRLTRLHGGLAQVDREMEVLSGRLEPKADQDGGKVSYQDAFQYELAKSKKQRMERESWEALELAILRSFEKILQYNKAMSSAHAISYSADHPLSLYHPAMLFIDLHSKFLKNCKEYRIMGKTSNPSTGSCAAKAFAVIFCVMESGRRLEIQIKLSDTIRALKGEIRAKEGITIQEQQLLFEGKLLEDNQTLADCNILSQSTLDLALHPPPDSRTNLFVKSLTGETCTVNADLSDLISSVKEKIQEKLGYPYEQQSLVFAGRRLEDENTLADSNIQKGCTIALVPRLRAC